MSDMVKGAAEKGQSRQKGYYDQHAKKRVLSRGDKVLVLLPSSANKLKLEWAGRYQVSRWLNSVDYEGEMPGRCRGKKIVHTNFLKKWNDPQKALVGATEMKVQQSEGAESSGELPEEGDDQDEPLNCNQ